MVGDVGDVITEVGRAATKMQIGKQGVSVVLRQVALSVVTW